MRRAKAIAIVAEKNPLQLAYESATNFSLFLIDLMYGTPERTKRTLAFCFLLGVLGAILNAGNANAMPVCVN